MLDVKGREQPPKGARTYKHPGAHRALIGLLGPAFVAAIAYVDPGNVAANLTAGARYGYLLLWVLVVANVIAVLVQYQSAKLGIVTGRSLPEMLGERLKRVPRRAYWVQAELVAAATDIAEVLGGAIALHLLFGRPAAARGSDRRRRVDGAAEHPVAPGAAAVRARHHRAARRDRRRLRDRPVLQPD